MYNFFFYARVSTQDQDLLSQKLAAESFCQQQNSLVNFKIIKYFEDHCSAYSQIPTNMIRMIQEIESMPPSERPYIMVKNVDRFSRSIDYGTQCIEKIISLGVEILFYEHPNLDVRTPEGREEFDKLLQEAQRESERISRRVSNSISARKAANILTTSVPPFGFKLDPISELQLEEGSPKYIVPEEEEKATQALIAMMNLDYTPNQLMIAIRIFEDNFRGGYSTKTVYELEEFNLVSKDEILYGTDKTFASVLNHFGIYKRGDEWTRSSINYQWNKYIKDQTDEWNSYISDMFGNEYIDGYHLVPQNDHDWYLV